MTIGLGLDTGGTYTDAVLYRFDDQAIVQTAKSVTVKEDLTIGINGVLDQMDPEQIQQVDLVSLSTTLATNACVEGKGGAACLVLIGCDRRIVLKYGQESGLPPADDIIVLAGGHSQTGQVTAEPDWHDLQEQIKTRDPAVDAYAVVELWGVRNATFEQQARDYLMAWTGKPVVCGHEITGVLDSLKRAASALLNARLLPLINAFLDAVRSSLDRRQIRAPLVIVRSDGSLMAEDIARIRPVETLLCGPAASAAGGQVLSGVKNGIIVDMGGTTSDIALIRNGQPVMSRTGAQIGSWRTGIRSILIQTVGLGGDSLIRHRQNKDLLIGPRRAAPLSWAAIRWPQLTEQLRCLYHEERFHTHSLAEFFYRIAKPSDLSRFDERERAILQALEDGPLSITDLANRVGASIYSLKTERLEQEEQVMRCGLTPTDIMHLTGEFDAWHRETAEVAADIMAFQLQIDRGQLIEKIRSRIREALFAALFQMLLSHEQAEIHDQSGPDSELVRLGNVRLEQFISGQKESCFLAPDFALTVPLIGIGAPIHLYLPPIAAFLKTDCLIPQHAAVANAVGAITGHVVATETVLIKPRYSIAGITGYDGYHAADTPFFRTHKAAVAWAMVQAEQGARQTALQRGAGQPDVQLFVDRKEVPVARVLSAGAEHEKDDQQSKPALLPASEDSSQVLTSQDLSVDSPGTAGCIYLETIVQARAIGRISL